MKLPFKNGGNQSYRENVRHQVLANLANFAYDPVNYEFLRQLNVLDLFLDTLEDMDPKLVEYAIGGICNLCLDRQNKDFLLRNDGIRLLLKCLSSSDEEVVLSAVTTLMFLVTPESREEITSAPVVECMLRFSQSSNKRLANVATVYLEDYCSTADIEKAHSLRDQVHDSKS